MPCNKIVANRSVSCATAQFRASNESFGRGGRNRGGLFLHSVRQLALHHNRTDGKARPECDRSSTRIGKPSSVEYVCKRSRASSFFFFRSRSNSAAHRALNGIK